MHTRPLRPLYPALLLASSLLASSLVLAVPTSLLAAPSCGDPNGAGGTNATDALIVLRKAVGGNNSCAPCACDANADAAITASDSLAVLRRAVGLSSFLACIAGADCATPQPNVTASLDDTVAAGALLGLSTSNVDSATPHWLRLFAGASFSIQIPAVIAEEGRIAAAMPPLTSPLTTRVQVLEGKGSSTKASNVLPGPTITPLPTPPSPPGQVTRDYLAGAIARSLELAEDIEELGDPDFLAAGTALEASAQALTTLDGLVAQAAAGGSPSLGFFDGQPLALTQADVVQVDALILGMLAARAAHVDGGPALHTGSPAGAASEARAARANLASGNCGQSFADTYYNDLENGQPTTASRDGYFSAPCAAQAFDTGFAVAQGSAALATGVMALAGAPAIALALPAAAVAYISTVGGNGLVMVGAALAEAGGDGVALIRQGVKMIESSMRSTLQSIVLPDLDGIVADMAQAVYELSEAFTDPPPPPTTTTSTTMTTLGGDDCYCCCAFWDGINGPFYCLESETPQQPGNGEEAVCNYYPASLELCGTGFCEE